MWTRKQGRVITSWLLRHTFATQTSTAPPFVNAKPFDHPSYRSEAYRVYFAVTNSCNRACPWCSTCSMPAANSWLPLATYARTLDNPPLSNVDNFAVQLEGGEPTIHPKFWDMVEVARGHPKCSGLVLCTNGVNLPRKRDELRAWLERLGSPVTVKMSINHYLISKDRGLLDLCQLLVSLFEELGGQRQLVFNVRLRRTGLPDPRAQKRVLESEFSPGTASSSDGLADLEASWEGPDAYIAAMVQHMGLLPHSNIFYLQRYGFAADEEEWDEPWLAGKDFLLVNPDGTHWGTDLVARSEHMRLLTERDKANRGSPRRPPRDLDLALRTQQYTAFDVDTTSTAKGTINMSLFGTTLNVYRNANMSIYSAQECNAKCGFCVEELRPASRGTELVDQRKTEDDDEVYFENMHKALAEVAQLQPSISITGGEPSIDPRLPRILRVVKEHNPSVVTLTTNASGLLHHREGKQNLDWVIESGVKFLNISYAHPEPVVNRFLMRLKETLTTEQLREVATRANRGGTRVRLSCVLIKPGVKDMQGVIDYVEFAMSIGVDNCIFRQLMKADGDSWVMNDVIRFTEKQRVDMLPLLDAISKDPRFTFTRQVCGYYYYVEVWRYKNMVDVVFEGADLVYIERQKQLSRAQLSAGEASFATVHELIYHPNAKLCSSWQPWDGILGPPTKTAHALTSD